MAKYPDWDEYVREYQKTHQAAGEEAEVQILKGVADSEQKEENSDGSQQTEESILPTSFPALSSINHKKAEGWNLVQGERGNTEFLTFFRHKSMIQQTSQIKILVFIIILIKILIKNDLILKILRGFNIYILSIF